jgi:hypothetical protein
MRGKCGSCRWVLSLQAQARQHTCFLAVEMDIVVAGAGEATHYFFSGGDGYWYISNRRDMVSGKRCRSGYLSRVCGQFTFQLFSVPGSWCCTCARCFSGC